LKIVDKILSDGEYFKEVFEKETLWLHHTAGSHRPDYSIDGWQHDTNKSGGKLPVACPYVIGGISTTDRNADFDGVIYRAHDDKYWAYHLGLDATNNNYVHQRAVSIEICNYGPLTKTKDGIFLNYVNRPVPSDMVGTLTVPFRGFTYFHLYTDKQLAALKELILDIATRHPKINLKAGLRLFLNLGAGALEINQGALKGVPGIWSHTNVRKDKFDIWPQPQIIDLIKTF
jgi:hypothetical protein